MSVYRDKTAIIILHDYTFTSTCTVHCNLYMYKLQCTVHMYSVIVMEAIDGSF